MKIGKGPLNISMIGFSENGEFSISKLKELAEDTLNFYPLRDIFNIKYIESKSNKDYPNFLWRDRGLRLKKDFDIITIIRKGRLSRYDGNIVYSMSNPLILAHELGHALGLKHPSIYCDFIYCGLEETCLYTKNIMGCDLDSREKKFSPDDIKKLEKWYLK